MHKQIKEPIEVLIASPEQLADLLGEAEAVLQSAAIAHGASGILVTRHEGGRYILALDESVPFGVTRERSLP